MLSVDISIEILTLGPSIRSITQHHNLLLLGKPSMTGAVLTLPLIMRGRHACVQQPTHMSRSRCARPHGTPWMQWHWFQSPWMDGILRAGSMFPVGSTGGMLWHKEPITSVWIVLPQNLQPWPLSWPRWLEPLAGERGPTDQLRHNHRLWLGRCLIPSPQSLLLTVTFVQIACGSSLDPKIHRTAMQPSQLSSQLSVHPCPVSCPVSIKSGKNHGPRDRLCNHLHTHFTSRPVIQVELVYVEQAMNTLVWKNSII